MVKLGFDIDGVLAAQFNSAFIKLFQSITGRDLFPADWADQLDKTYPSCWNYEREAGYTTEEIDAVWEHIEADPQFWYCLEPYAEVHSIVDSINNDDKVEAYFITNRMGTKVKEQTQEWLRDLDFWNPTVLIAGDKIPIINSLGLDAYIDDKPSTIEQACADTKARVYLMDRPYNKDVKVGVRVGSVQAMLELEGLWTA